MNLDLQFLKSKGAICKHFKKNEIVFYEFESAQYYYQILHGSVKLFNANDDGKQFLHGIFSDGNSFGEAPLLVDVTYPSTAAALTDTTIMRLPKENFRELLIKQPELQKALLELFATRLLNQAVTTNEIINHTPEARILAFFDSFKRKQSTSQRVEIPYTRQLIADFTGLRVETVIRTLCKMKSLNKIDIVNRKVIY